MPHQYAGKYSAKHPPGTKTDPVIAAAVEEAADEGRISCAVAHDIAEDLGVTPAEVGKTVDLLEHRINKCQMGLFGYLPGKRILEPAATVSDQLRDRLLGAAVEGKVACVTCWDIARAEGVQKIAVAAVCETLGLKVKPCQLGAF